MLRTALTINPPDEHLCTDLTAKQERVWRAMRTLQKVNGDRPPTRQEIADSIGVTTTTGAAVHFGVLSSLGYIVRELRGNREVWRAVIPTSPEVRVVTPTTLALDGNSYAAPTVSGAPSTADGLTIRNIMVWGLMWERQRVEGVPPTQGELSKLLGMKSPQGVQSHLYALAAKGYVVNKRRMWIAVCKDSPSCASLPLIPPPTTSHQPDRTAEPPQPSPVPLSQPNPFLAG